MGDQKVGNVSVANQQGDVQRRETIRIHAETIHNTN
jgi:hypothetical protein